MRTQLRSAAWWRDNEPVYDGSHDEWLAWLNRGKPATDEQKRFFAYRDAGYDGWLDRDSRPVDDTEQARLNAAFGRQRPGDPGVDAGSGLDAPPAAEPYTPPHKPPPDLADLRRGRWYDEKPITTSTGSAGGAVSSIEEVRAGIAASNEHANEGLGAIQQAHASLETAQGALMRATEGSGQADVSDAMGMLAQSLAALEEARQMVPAVISANEGVAERL